jgi:hypothetical protein
MPFHITTLPPGTQLYHERDTPFPRDELFSTFPYAFYSLKKGFWTGASLSSPPHNSHQYWQYIYQTRKALHLVDLSRPDAFSKMYQEIQKRIPVFPSYDNDHESDYAISAMICQVMKQDGYIDHDTVVLAKLATKTLSLKQVRSINMTVEEEARSKIAANCLTYGNMPCGDGYEPNPEEDLWVNLTQTEIQKYSAINWSKLFCLKAVAE